MCGNHRLSSPPSHGFGAVWHFFVVVVRWAIHHICVRYVAILILVILLIAVLLVACVALLYTSGETRG